VLAHKASLAQAVRQRKGERVGREGEKQERGDGEERGRGEKRVEREEL
jgi:hypothetical protein